MSLATNQTLEVIEAMENFLTRRRPPPDMRHKIDLTYSIDKQSITILELRPGWAQPETTVEINIAKATFVQTKNCWKVFWQRSDLKWHSYTPSPTVQTVSEFVKVVEEDKHHCFWG